MHGAVFFASAATCTLVSGVLATPAHAADDDAAVTMYGLIDLGVGSTHVSGTGTRNGLVNGGEDDSVWGLRGQDDLGAGWRALFQLENGFNPSNGRTDDQDGRLFNYQSWVGFENDAYGRVTFGRQHTIGQAFGNQLEQAGWKDMGLGATFKASDNFSFDNLVNYVSPSVGGWALGLGYSFDAAKPGGYAASASNRAFSAGLKYEQGPWLAVATWDQMRLGNTVATHAQPRALQLGIAYDFQIAKVALGWSRQSQGYVGLDGSDPDDLGVDAGPQAFVDGGHVNAWFLGVTVPVGKDSIVLQWSPMQPSWRWDDGQRARRAQLATVGYIHELSPRTSLYGFVGYASHYTLDNQFDPDGSHTTRVVVGMQHHF
ncbi:porin [Bordetella sp. N]|uniref:porin n=1 Tax=Bordetella sp. N TaxID=1746199 RepID=UPI00070ECE50|nr:porin [Bordetella sp. N]ALM87067.1 porin [Bordetella sp. N]